MKNRIAILWLLSVSLLLAACTGTTGAVQTEAPTETNETDVAATETADDTQEDQPLTETDEATEPQESTENETDEGDNTTEVAATETPADTGRITNYEVDFSDVEGIRSMTTGHADDDLFVLAVVSEEEEAEQTLEAFRVENGQKTSLLRFTIPQTLEFIGALSGDDDEIVFTAVERTDANRAGYFSIYRVDLDDGEVHRLYEGAADELNYGHNLMADDDVVFFTENMWEQDGLYFADLVMLKDDGKQIVNVEVLPSEHVSLLMDDDALLYAAARDDQQFVVKYDYDDNVTHEYQVAGDNANFRLTDYDDGVYLLDNYNGHPEMTGSMVLRLHVDAQDMKSFAIEGRNLHSAVFADDDEPIVAVSSSGTQIRWAEGEPDQTGVKEIAGDVEIPAGSAMTGVFEEDDEVVRYPKAVSQEYYGNFKLIYQVYR